MNPEKLRQKIARLQRKGKIDKAIGLQEELCRADESNGEAWSLLSTLAQQGARHELEVTARVTAARLLRSGPPVWLEIAELAGTHGLRAESIEARFRAADGYAVIGDFRRSLACCEQVLTEQPEHRPARRIHELMSARLNRGILPADGPSPVVEPPPGAAASPAEATPPAADDEELLSVTSAARRPSHQLSAISLPSLEQEDPLSLEEITKPGWPPVGRKGPFATSLEQYVSMVQPWPSVLDHSGLIFMGQNADLRGSIAPLVESVSLAADATVFRQGAVGQILYCLDVGRVRVSRDRGGVQDLGEVKSGSFFGEVGTVAGLPCTTSVVALEECSIRVVSREKLRAQMDRGRSEASEFLKHLKSWHLETVSRICPLFATLEHLSLGRFRRVTFHAGDPMAVGGSSGALLVILSGVARVETMLDGELIAIGFLCAGDLVGEMDPSPVWVTALSLTSALEIPRETIGKLPGTAREEFGERIATCEEALAQIQQGLVG